MRDQNVISKISNSKCELLMNENFKIKTITEIKKILLGNGQLATFFATGKQRRIESTEISKLISRVN